MGKKLRLAAGVSLLAWLAWQTDWGQAADAFHRLRWEIWLAAAGLYGVSQVVSSLRWQMLARPLGFNCPLGRMIAFYFIGMFFNLVLPTSVGGDVVRAWYLNGESDQRSAALLSVILDRLSGLLVLIVLACGGVLVCPLRLPPWLVGVVWGTAAVTLAGLGAVPLLARCRLLSAKHQDLSASLKKCLPLLLRPAPLVLSTVVQCANVALVWLIGRSLGVPVPASYYWILVPVVTLLTLLPVSLNGMGVREGGTVLLLGLQGVSPGPALTLALLWFAVFAAAGLAGAPVYLFGSFPRFQVRTDDQSLGDRADQGRAGQYPAAA